MANNTNKKLVFVLLDGLTAKVAKNNMGFLNHLLEQNLASYYTVQSELPAMSRPLYEVLMTGVNSIKNRIVSNDTIELSSSESIFKLCRDAGLKSAASAYYWVSDLYNKIPFDKAIDIIQLDNTDGLIQNGFFYYEDQYPDSHVIAGGNYLIKEKNSDFTLIHTMNIDYAGHLYGVNSKEYLAACIKVDSLLAPRILEWMNMDMDIIVTADHGMNEFGYHNGISKNDRHVPLFIISKSVKPGDYSNIIIPQIQVAPLICRLLGIEKGKDMTDSFDIRVNI